jgi:hypothetical protein
LLIVATDTQATPQTVEEFRQRGNIASLPWTIDRSGEIARSLSAGALETTIIDREGKIAYRDTTSTDYETLERELQEAAL